MVDIKKALSLIHDESLYLPTKRLPRTAKLYFLPLGHLVSNRWECWSIKGTKNNYCVLETVQGNFIPLSITDVMKYCKLSNNSAINDTNLKRLGVTKVDDIYAYKKPINVLYNDTSVYMAIHIPASVQVPYGTKGDCPVVVNNARINNHGASPSGDFLVCKAVDGQPDLSTLTLINGAVFRNDFSMQYMADAVLTQRDINFLKKVTLAGRYSY